MSRNLADLKAECDRNNLVVKQSGKREAKADFEAALRQYYWLRDHAGEEMAEQIKPMLARNLKDVEPDVAKSMMADNSGWVAQEKINGCRMMIKFRNPAKGRINICTSRNLSDETYRFSEYHHHMPHYRDLDMGDEWEDTVVDGEVLSSVNVVDTSVFDGDGVQTLDILQATAATMNCSPEKSVAIQNAFGKLVIHAFDCLRFKGRDIRDLPYVVLAKDGTVDTAKESRYGYLMQVIARVVEVMGELPCEHCSGVRRIEVKKPAEPAPELPMIEQDSFDDIING